FSATFQAMDWLFRAPKIIPFFPFNNPYDIIYFLINKSKKLIVRDIKKGAELLRLPLVTYYLVVSFQVSLVVSVASSAASLVFSQALDTASLVSSQASATLSLALSIHPSAVASLLLRFCSRM